MINVSVIGCTGSVGTSVMDICRIFPDRFRVVSLAAHSSISRMIDLCREFKPEKVLMADRESALEIKRHLPESIAVLSGDDRLVDLVEDDRIDHVVFSSSGTSAIHALKRALEVDLDVSLANKESIVAAGPWIMPAVKRADQLRPLDSEHNAIWQCLRHEDMQKVSKVYLTASGGPFLDLPEEDFESITVERALKHPVWKMGGKITIDSATLMNKGIELMEAMYLFNLDPDQLQAVVHPGSFVHGIVEFRDTSLKMSASTADMRIPAASCLGFPDRLPISERSFSFPEIFNRKMEFRAPDIGKFPCLGIAMKALREGGAFPSLILGADEIAVQAFLDGKINFPEIAGVIESVLSSYTGKGPSTIEDAIDIIEWGRIRADEICG